ncbi:ASCH domain-containing protein, partial [Escherichia sp. Lx600-2]|uniref:ASCH domain-containing protein n=1 Tax=Escherichia sp. Lx600-2 TaxID=2994672 RepID=UPI002FCB2FA2
MTIKEKILQKYPHASFCTFGDSAALADHLATLIATGVKTASCGSLAGCIEDNAFPMIGEYKIVENSRGEPVCVIRVIGLHLLRFSDVTAGNDSNLLIVFYVQIMPDDFVMQLHR